MAIDALTKFRDKYPEYADKSDSELANALATKFPAAYGGLPKQVARESVIDTYSPGTRESARMAMNRPNMLERFKATAGYNPTLDPNLSIGKKIIGGITQPIKTALLGLGAAGQIAEGAVSAPIVAMQRGSSPINPEFYNTIGRSVSGEEPTELGDITRNIGASEPTSQIFGLVGSSMLPGVGEAQSAIGKGANLIKAGIINKGLKPLVKGVEHGTQTTIGRIPAEYVNHALKKGYSMIKPGQSASAIEKELSSAVLKAKATANQMQKEASALYGEGLKAIKNKPIDLSQPITENGANVIDNAMDSLRDLGIHEAEVKVKGGGTMIKIVGDSFTPKTKKLATIVDELDNSVKLNEPLTAGELHLRMNQLDNFILDNYENATKMDKAISVEAVKLQKNLRELMATQYPEFKVFNDAYKNKVQYLHSNPDTLEVGLNELTKLKQGKVDLKDPAKLSKETKDMLVKLDASLPDDQKFLDNLMDAATNNAFKQKRLGIGASALGLGALASKTAINPLLYIPVTGSAVLASSPRFSALVSKGIRNFVHSGTNIIKSKVLGTPIADTLKTLIDNGVIGGGILRETTGRNQTQ